MAFGVISRLHQLVCKKNDSVRDFAGQICQNCVEKRRLFCVKGNSNDKAALWTVSLCLHGTTAADQSATLEYADVLSVLPNCQSRKRGDQWRPT